MKITELLFSRGMFYRIARHLAFWTIHFIMLFLWNLGQYFKTVPDGFKLPFAETISRTTLWMPFLVDIIFCYAVAYWLWPRYLMQKKYSIFVVLASVLTIVAHAIDYAYSLHAWGSGSFVFLEPLPECIRAGPLGVCVFFMTIKMLREWHFRQEVKLMLIRENARAELQLLKAQVHPHFLFNTLNSIYSFTLSQSTQAADLVLKLSDMMRYMIDNNEAAWVPLEKELKMINDYIGLEQVRYGSRLDLKISITGNYRDKLIAPLLIIPFVENSFKHGASKVGPNAWIYLAIDVTENTLYFSLRNNKLPDPPEAGGKSGIGLINIQKRLQLLYTGTHSLKLENSADVFSVQLRIPLKRKIVTETFVEMPPVLSTETSVYA